jgi:2-polyprenyl-3-methyl-5-hydroxy-6-metoxy-1,4-benzoquinol methylase
MSFFEFLKSTRRYGENSTAIARLNVRRDFLVAPYETDLADARVLDLASHDGRWSYALSAAGAREVVGVEARPELIEQFDEFPDDEQKKRISFVQGDIFEELPKMIERGEQFDVVAIYGLYYHIMDHYQLLKLVQRLGPKLVIIDSEFAVYKQPMIKLIYEDTRKFLNTIAHTEGQLKAPIGIPSFRAMEVMAESLGYDVEWADWMSVPEDKRDGLNEYFRTREDSDRRRSTCALRPAAV